MGSDRCNNICRYTREYVKKLGDGTSTPNISGAGFYSGPNQARGWTGGNGNLDSTLTNYKQIDPKQPSIMWDGSTYVGTLAPAFITDNRQKVYGIRYRSKLTAFPFDDFERFGIRDYPSGDDLLIVFEGGTGNFDNSEPAWSLMGFVLIRKTPTGFDAHIVFRGSRGGSVGRTIIQAQGNVGVPNGNPDWVTDLVLGTHVENLTISKAGMIIRGFGLALHRVPLKLEMRNDTAIQET